MTWDEIQRNYPQHKNALQQHFDKLTSEDVAQGENSKDRLAERISERYGYSQAQAQEELDDFAQQQDADQGQTNRT